MRLESTPDRANVSCGVSLHSHTNFSKENLQFIPAFAEKWPVLQRALDKQCKKSCRPVDFSTAYWRPPVSAKAGFELESKQIESALDLMSLVSLTDHDSIGAATSLRQSPDNIQIPFAVEWSVPFKNAVFHLGVHNLPQKLAPTIMEDFAEYTRNPGITRLLEIMAGLHEIPEVLIVFNHPLWDQLGPGQLPFQLVLEEFLRQHVEFIHAFESTACVTGVKIKGSYSWLRFGSGRWFPAATGMDASRAEH